MTRDHSRIQQAALFCVSLLLSLLFLFTLFEIFPHLPARLGLTRIHYYALKERYLSDPGLIIKMKPFYSYRGFFPGDIAGFKTKSSYKPLPYEAHYDRNGFRNNHPDGFVDAVILGDSYMEVGLTNDDTFAAHLEKTTGLSVANYGMGWYGPFQYLEVLKRYGLAHKPKIAFFSFFEGNDLKDTRDYMDRQKTGSYHEFSRYSGNFLQRFFLCLRDTVRYAGKFLVRRWDPRRAEIKLKNGIFYTVFVYPVDTRPAEELAKTPEIQKIKELFLQFRETCEENKIRPVILYIPSKAHVYISQSSMPGMSRQSVELQIKQKDEMEKAIRTAAEDAGVEWLSFTELFEKTANEGFFVYYETDTHWNTSGQKLAAELVKSYLAENK